MTANRRTDPDLDGRRILLADDEDILRDTVRDVLTGYGCHMVFAAAKHANAATPVILTTGFGYDPNHSIMRARREGLAAVLFKPFKVDQLLAEIRAALKAAVK